MRKITTLVLALVLFLGLVPTTTQARVHHDDMRAVWVSTIYNLDYPHVSTQNNPEAQKKQYIDMLNELQKIGINTVFVQVRPKADALYNSSINPWSDILTGQQGKYPGYDPLEFMIDEAHKRGISFHAWLNPYRVTTSGTDVNALSPLHPARLNPDWVLAYNDKLYYNPEHPEVKEHIADTVAEIVNKYDVDGIHFDDYFYPSHYPLPNGEHRDGVTANARREHINDMVKLVGNTIEAIDDDVMFGISPIGIWKNQKSDSQGSATDGGEGYYSVFADAKAWIENEWIDYIIPQIYWEIGHPKADYKTLVEWWSNQVSGTDVKLYIGQGIYKDIIASNITKQLKLNEQYKEVEGNAYFSVRDLLSNRQGVSDSLKAYYGQSTKPPVEPELPDTNKPYKVGVVTTDNLNMREGMGTNYPILQKLPLGVRVKVLEENNEWYKIQLGNQQVGYVSSQYIKLSNDIRLIIDGTQVLPDVAPFLAEGTTLVPLRIISENLDAKVDWDNDTKMVTITKGNDTLLLFIDDTMVYANGEPIELSLAPRIINSTTMVPIRFISENLGAKVDWDAVEKIVTITSN